MRFSLQTLFVGLIIFFVIMGAIFVFLAAQVFHHNLITRIPEHLSENVIREALIAVAVQQGFIIFAMLAIVGGILFFVLHAFILVPLRELRASLQQVGKENFDVRLPKGPNNEMGDLFEAFNAMTSRLEESKDRDEQVSRMKSEFLSIAAHQLRTPLSALKWVLNMALEGDAGKLTKAQQELLEKGYGANERMIALVNDLLDVVRIEEGRFDYKFEKGAVAKVIESIVKETKVIADQKGVELSLHKPSRELPEIALDAVKFRLAVSNIIANAVQYTPAHGRVDVELTLNEDEILVVVRDTGVGIPKHQLHRVFTKFFRGDNAVRIQTAGSGLGLFISKNIIEKHKGKVWIESEEGKGTSVYFTLPVAR